MAEMLHRRKFLKSVGALAAATALFRKLLAAQAASGESAQLFMSDSIAAQLSPTAPEFLNLTIDGLGKGRRGPNIVDGRRSDGGYKAAIAGDDARRRIEYRVKNAADDSPASWAFELAGNRIVLTSNWSAEFPPAPFVCHFDLNQVHSTVLGLFHKDGQLAVPVLIHSPGQGSIRLTASIGDIGLTYQSIHAKPIASLSLPGATQEHGRAIYTFEVAAIHPEIPSITGDPRFDPFRRNWLNTLQLNPEYPALANNTTSDTCAFCYYEFADIAALTPPLAEGLTALDVVRQTLDRILAGGTAYGLPHPGFECCPSAFSDALPALLIAAANVVREGRNDRWLAENYDGIRGWAETLLASDTDGDGLFKYSVSGNSGIWKDGAPTFRPSNWWDTIGFGHEDAYGNALAYRALRNTAELAQKAGKPDDGARYLAAGERLRAAYFRRFYDSETGVLGGWRSADGQLHDYYFLWVNGIAIHYGLVEKPRANAIMDKLMAKMKAVGYDRFDMGLPGNLITVALKDCVDKRGEGRFGCGAKPDNSDGFQNYENGGATGAFVFFTLAALYDLGRNQEADAILFPMLRAYGDGGFEGRDAKGFSPDWRRWDGANKGYEGYLTDNFYTMLAVPLRQSESRWKSGFRPATTLT
jgi:hypothetical protein